MSADFPDMPTEMDQLEYIEELSRQVVSFIWPKQDVAAATEPDTDREDEQHTCICDADAGEFD